jgi:Xaa-Pro aminopeptidase
MTISNAEYRARQQSFAEALGAAGLAGALVVSRGGATADRYASVRYLTGHYQNYSYLPDAPGLFSGRAHTALAIAADGRNILCVSVPEYDAGALVADDIRHADNFAAGVADTLKSLGLTGRGVGLVGEDVLPLRIWRALSARLPALDLIVCDELLERLRRIKSPAEQALIREAAAIHRRGTTALLAALRPGVSEAEAVAELAATVIAAGAGLYFTSMSSGSGVGRWTSVPHPGFGRRILQDGDMVRFDMGVVWQGYLSDYGRSRVVGSPSRDQSRLLAALHGGLDAAIGAVRPGATVREVVAAGEQALAAAGVAQAGDTSGGIVSSFPVHWGHGLGLGWERPWLTETEDMTIEPGMYLAIERALTLHGVGTASGEQDLLVGPDGVEILSEGPAGRWT